MLPLITLLILATLGVTAVVAVVARSTAVAVITEAISRVVAIASVFCGSLFVIPRYKQFFENFAVELPTATSLLLSASDLIVRFWYAVAGLALLLLTIDLLLFYGLHSVPGNRHMARALSGIVSAATILVFVASILSIMLVTLSITQSLS